MIDCIILAGGLGTRMNSTIPKALIKIGRPGNELPILEYQLRYLEGFNNTNRIILALGYQSDLVKSYVSSRRNLREVICSVEERPLGTAGAMRKALDHVVEEYFVGLNVDDLTNIDLDDLERYGRDAKENVLCVAHPRLPFGLVVFGGNYVEFREKPILEDKWVSCGWYLLKKEIKDVLPDKGSLEYDIFQKGVVRLIPYKHEGIWFTLNTPKDIEYVRHRLHNLNF